MQKGSVTNAELSKGVLAQACVGFSPSTEGLICWKILAMSISASYPQATHGGSHSCRSLLPGCH